MLIFSFIPFPHHLALSPASIPCQVVATCMVIFLPCSYLVTSHLCIPSPTVPTRALYSLSLPGSSILSDGRIITHNIAVHFLNATFQQLGKGIRTEKKWKTTQLWPCFGAHFWPRLCWVGHLGSTRGGYECRIQHIYVCVVEV